MCGGKTDSFTASVCVCLSLSAVRRKGYEPSVGMADVCVCPGCGVQSLSVCRFIGKMSRIEAEQCLHRMKDGVFLIRESDARQGEYAVALRYYTHTDKLLFHVFTGILTGGNACRNTSRFANTRTPSGSMFQMSQIFSQCG